MWELRLTLDPRPVSWFEFSFKSWFSSGVTLRYLGCDLRSRVAPEEPGLRAELRLRMKIRLRTF